MTFARAVFHPGAALRAVRSVRVASELACGDFHSNCSPKEFEPRVIQKRAKLPALHSSRTGHQQPSSGADRSQMKAFLVIITKKFKG